MSDQVIKILLILAIGIGGVYLGLAIVRSPNEWLGLFAGSIAALVCLAVASRERDESGFLVRLSLLALGLRWLVALAIFQTHLFLRIGPDVITYDESGYALLQAWQGLIDPNAPGLLRHTSIQRSGWGMYYYVASVYYLLGRNILAIQLINCAFGAISCIFVYKIAYIVFPQQRVARLAAILVAVSPSMVLWTAQGLKESPIILCLCLCTYYTLRLCRNFEAGSLLLLLPALFCLYSLRHYAFVITFFAVVGALLFSMKKFTPARALQVVVIILLLGLAFVYFGADEVTQKSLNLERLQRSRDWGVKAGSSGFGGEVDITETRSALIYLPLGVLYVLFAPFPWMIGNLVQLATLPEMLVWWAAVPFMIKGYWVAIKRRFSEALPLCLFTMGLTLVYALFQTNGGTVHRQRAQLLTFFLIFVAIGWDQRRAAKRVRSAWRAPLPPSYQSHLPIGVTEQTGGGSN